MKRVTAVVFAMGDYNHFRRTLPVVEGLARAGVTTYVFTSLRFCEDVTRAGGRFVNLFLEHSLEQADAKSIPLPCRAVTFAGLFGDAVVKAAAALQPSLVVHDTFAVIGRVVANHLGVPRVNVCAGHNLAPAPTLAALSRDPRVRIDDVCWEAVQNLKDRHGMPDASPFSYISAISPDLNLYCEPAEFLPPEDRVPFEPIAFFGSLWPDGLRRAHASGVRFGRASNNALRIYASFGTIIWRYYEEAAIAAFDALVNALAERTDAEAIISLGGAGPSALAARWASRNIQVAAHVDQWEMLRDASFYVTHQGLNSTHEAIYHGVPMISYPFFWDQPGLSARCQDLGLAVPVVNTMRGSVAPADMRAALDRVAALGPEMKERLAVAREWELRTIRDRPAVIEQMINLAA